MFTRKVVIVLFLAAAATFGVSGRAAACLICDQFLHCIAAPTGAKACAQFPGACALAVPCVQGLRRTPDLASGEDDLTALTLYDASAGAGRTSSLKSEAGPLAVGEEARALGGPDARADALAEAALVYGDEYAISFVDDSGDGFALDRSVEGGRVRVEVREVAHDVPGRVIANEVLGPRDQLSVPVRVEGRDRVMLLHAAKLHGGGNGPEAAHLRQALRDAGLRLPPRGEPLLHVHAR